MRQRDIRAIVFCAVTICIVFATAQMAVHATLFSLALTGAYAAWLLTRARMIRVFRRMRGDTGWDWSNYYRE